MNTDKLNNLSSIDFTNFIPSENNVKYKIVIPFLQAFSHHDLDLEHAAQGSRIDINIGNRIIVETKALGINLDNCVQQLSNYSGREIPILAILTNGKQFRIYSPQWRQLKNFSEKLIYQFELSDLIKESLVKRLEKILAFKNYENDEFIDHIEDREREIMEARKKIETFNTAQYVELSELNMELEQLQEQLQEIKTKIIEKQRDISEFKNKNQTEIFEVNKEHLLPNKNIVAITKPPTNQLDNNPLKGEQAEIEKVKKRVPKWLNSPGQANHKIIVAYLQLLRKNDFVPLVELQKACYSIENFGSHYIAMKSISDRNHGKVFTEKNKHVFLWEPIKNFILLEYEKYNHQ